jgi:hypothetical protein
VLSEEALLILATAVACGLLALGVVEMVRPRRRALAERPVHGYRRRTRPAGPLVPVEPPRAAAPAAVVEDVSAAPVVEPRETMAPRAAVAPPPEAEPAEDHRAPAEADAATLRRRAEAALARAEAEDTLAGPPALAALGEAALAIAAARVAGASPAWPEADLAAAAERLWTLADEAATGAVVAGDFAPARALAQELLADPALPGTRAAAFRDLAAEALAGEVAALTARVVEHVAEPRAPASLAALEEAERLVARAPGGLLSEARRQEIERRLWWGYTTLGARRLEIGATEEAVEALLPALRFPAVGPPRLRRTAEALSQALALLAERGARDVAAARAAGRDADADRLAAAVGTALERARAAGLAPDLLAPALAAAGGAPAGATG